MKTTATIIVSIFILGFLIVGGFVLKIVLFPVTTATNLIDTAYDANSKVINADNAIYNYEWFKQTYQDIQANEQQLANATSSLHEFEASAGDRKNWDFQDKEQDGQLRTVVLGLQNYLATNIANYNARASEATRNIFEHSVLPNYISALTFITK